MPDSPTTPVSVPAEILRALRTCPCKEDHRSMVRRLLRAGLLTQWWRVERKDVRIAWRRPWTVTSALSAEGDEYHDFVTWREAFDYAHGQAVVQAREAGR